MMGRIDRNDPMACDMGKLELDSMEELLPILVRPVCRLSATGQRVELRRKGRYN